MLLLIAILSLLGSADEDQRPAAPSEDPAARALVEALSQAGVHLDLAARAAHLDVRVLVKEDLLEYLLVGPGGAAHESLFLTTVEPSMLNAGLLALGVAPGANASYAPVEPPPTLEERKRGAWPYVVTPPRGDGFYLYAAWREAGELFFYRVEDLIANLATNRAMARHRWVFLGSAFVKDPKGEGEVFAADLHRNLINLTFFREGHTLLTAALADCEDQSIWIANPWLLPPAEARVRLIFAREPLAELPADWLAELPVIEAPASVRQAPGERDG
jgi:hypothetical protein